MNSLEKKELLLNEIKDLFKCPICFSLPRNLVLQCRKGHIMCLTCFRRIILDVETCDGTPRCPFCRVELSRYYVIRNTVIEQILALFPAECQFCENGISKHLIKIHEEFECEMRITHCPQKDFGCNWTGFLCTLPEHQLRCKILGVLQRKESHIFYRICRFCRIVD